MWLEIGQAIIDFIYKYGGIVTSFFENIPTFFQNLLKGVGTVTNLLSGSVDKVSEYTSFLPPLLSSALLGVVALISGLAVVRWIT